MSGSSSTRTPIKPSVPSRATATTSIYATKESVDKLTTEVKECKAMLAEILSIVKAAPPPPAPAPVPIPSLLSSIDRTREMYETFSKVISDKAVYKDKARRSVIIGLPEVNNPSKGLAADEKTVKDLIAYSGCPEVIKAFNNNEVTHHRHPRDRSPDHRSLKVEFLADSINESFLSGVRSKVGRPAPLVEHSFVRMDLTPTQLKMEREARIEVRRRNLAAGKLQFGVRDYYIIEYRNPRPLPANYGNRAPNARNKNKSADSLTADLAASSSSSLCSTFTARSGSFTDVIDPNVTRRVTRK